ncbi:YSIRK-type signal peptide-containing protein [Streptococcus pyogenes]|uniref:YSIRK-type signal peptide-containing protein n=1 Tax=Streptococcus pyogenes TaxID=1314 RepID=UPI0010A17CBE|nr:YSIRK-type signal peptide-containing protein [Streptococcus pyogenes]VGU36702.1 M protein, serotype 49 [Streptococcus pyogenes]HEP1291619.1 YSIRK-type signal peptide-containing protein [Streptococcus pyogenes]
MTRQQTKKNYSLRKLKTGTASVAVALTVLGAGFANQTEVKAESSPSVTASDKSQWNLTEEYNKLHEENERLKEEIGGYLDKQEQLEQLERQSQIAADKRYQEQVKKYQEYKQEQEERQKNQEQLERKYQREVEKRYQEQQQKQQQLEAENQKLTEANKVSEASRKGLSNDLEASRAAKKELEAKHQKLEADHQALEAKHQKLAEEHQVSETSRKGLSRDLEASREANKKVTSELTQAKAQLSALEESKKLSEKEKAELQAKLDAQGKALKEQLAKQAEELAKLRAEKAAGSKTPATKPANKERSGRAAQTATRPIQNKGMRSQLPSTGEAANPFFTAAAATVMVSAGMLALKRKEEN